MIEKKFRFIPAECIYLDRPKVCPVKKGSEFTARLDGKDVYRVYQSPGGDHPNADRYFAGCPDCHSHKLVEEV